MIAQIEHQSQRQKGAENIKSHPFQIFRIQADTSFFVCPILCLLVCFLICSACAEQHFRCRCRENAP